MTLNFYRMHYFLSLLILFLVSLGTYAQENSEEEFITMDNTANGINNEGYEAMERGDYEQAKQLFRQAIAIDSSAVPYYENLAIACHRSDDQAG